MVKTTSKNVFLILIILMSLRLSCADFEDQASKPNKLIQIISPNDGDFFRKDENIVFKFQKKVNENIQLRGLDIYLDGQKIEINSEYIKYARITRK